MDRKEIELSYDIIDYCYTQAETCKRLYYQTKGKKGLYKIINKIALKLNQRYCRIGKEEIQKYYKIV